MPRKPKHPCAYPGCKELTEKRYCPEHLKLTNKQYERYGRDPATKNRYGRAWHRIRTSYAKEHPFCELCMKDGILTPTDQVHHIRPLSEGGSHSRDNLMALCTSCHSRVHAQRGDRWHRKNGDADG